MLGYIYVLKKKKKQYLSLVRRGRFVTSDCSKFVRLNEGDIVVCDGDGDPKNDNIFFVDFCAVLLRLE